MVISLETFKQELLLKLFEEIFLWRNKIRFEAF